MIKLLAFLLHCTSCIGFENDNFINTGLGFCTEIDISILEEVMKDYGNITFILTAGLFDSIPCPVRNTDVFIRHGFK